MLQIHGNKDYPEYPTAHACMVEDDNYLVQVYQNFQSLVHGLIAVVCMHTILCRYLLVASKQEHKLGSVEILLLSTKIYKHKQEHCSSY